MEVREGGDCVVCSAAFSPFTLLHPSTADDSVDGGEGVSETFCQFLQLPLTPFKQRLTQENVFFCPNCFNSLNQISRLMGQLKALRIELKQLKNSIHTNLINAKSKTEQGQEGEELSGTLRTDIIEELKLSCSRELNTASAPADDQTYPENDDTADEIFGDIDYSPPPPLQTEPEDDSSTNAINDKKSVMVLESGFICGNVFKAEIRDELENEGQDSFLLSQVETIIVPDPLSDHIPEEKTRRTRGRPKLKAALKTIAKVKQSRVVTPKRLSTSPTKVEPELRVKLKRLKDGDLTPPVRSTRSSERGRRKQTLPRKLRVDGIDDEEWSPTWKKLKREPSSSPSPPRKKKQGQKRQKSRSSKKQSTKEPKAKRPRDPPKQRLYLHCDEDECSSKFPIVDGDREKAEARRDAHVRKIHEGIATPFQCSDCPKSFAFNHQLEVHFRKHTGERPFICEFCGKGFRGDRLLQIHSKIHTRSGERNFCCKLCPEKFLEEVSLKAHQITHTKIRSFICEICSASFLRKLDMQIHQRFNHSKELGLEPYTCSQCGKIFTRKFLLVAHEKSHVSEGDFKCKYCEFRHHIKSRLNAHEKDHELERSFQCDQCDKAYKKEHQLTVHKRIHTGERPFTCKTCGKAYKAYGHLYQHEATHAKELNFKCSFCGRGFVIRKYLLRHEERHRKGKLQRGTGNKGGLGTRKKDMRIGMVPLEDILEEHNNIPPKNILEDVGIGIENSEEDEVVVIPEVVDLEEEVASEAVTLKVSPDVLTIQPKDY